MQRSPEKWPTLHKHRDRLHITHALPVKQDGNRRPVTMPLSVAKGDAITYPDIAGEQEPGLVRGKAPLFFIDWKPSDWKEPSRLYGLTSPPENRLEIRTEIDPTTGSSRQGNLFSMETVVPDGHHWLANLDLGAIEPAEDHLDLIRELGDLLQHPLTHLGKTKVLASVTPEPSFPYTCEERVTLDHPVIVYLQTHARLLLSGFRAEGTNRGEKLRDAYNEAWHQLSGGALKLVRFYARQQLLGGSYRWNRFRKPNEEEGAPYAPELFSCPGSVFVLDVMNADGAQNRIDEWRKLGLPQLDDAPGGEDWQQNPWIRENGYGEIAVNIEPLQVGKEGENG